MEELFGVSLLSSSGGRLRRLAGSNATSFSHLWGLKPHYFASGNLFLPLSPKEDDHTRPTLLTVLFEALKEMRYKKTLFSVQ